MAERKLKGFVTDVLLGIQKNLFIAIGNTLYSMTTPVIEGMSRTVKALPDATDIKNPQEFLDSYFTNMLSQVYSGNTKDPGTLLLFLFTVILSSGKYPLTISNLIGEKYFDRDARRKIRPLLLDSSTAMTAMLREIITSEKVDVILSSMGYENDDIEVIKKSFLTVPGVQDIISFAVREVYSPEIAAAFGQYEGADGVYNNAAKDIKAAGMTKETFSKYWAAHWVLPSINQGFEMLHRKEISDDDLGKLFQALDIMPYWRDKLKAISYNPLTRVDVRRMHKIGVLDETAVLKAYKDVGYNDINAGLMRDFTLAYNAETPTEDITLADTQKVKEKDLTKSDIIRMYKSKVIEREDAEGFLASIGYSTDEIELYLDREDLNKELDKLDDYIKLYKEAYIEGVYSETDLRAKFGELNLPDKQVEYYITLWDITREVKTAVPSKSELFRFYNKEIITEDTLRRELQHLKYDDLYIDWYIRDLKEGK